VKSTIIDNTRTVRYSEAMSYENYVKDDDEFYLTVGDLRSAMKDLPDNAKVYYQRIEDVYFEKHGWKPDLLVPDDFMPDERELDNQYVRAFAGFKYDGRLCLTAHY